ncbi:TPA: hypothetical protein QDA91_003112 [Burkholderia vietnamiensis]|nr:hypothetical protein [Burkholderia vietnamiensis]
MQALKVTFHLETPYVSPGYPIHLDALVAYAMTQSSLDLLPEGADVQDLRALADRLPFGRHEQDGEWVWQASALMPAGVVRHSSHFYTQRRNERTYADLVGSGEIIQGRYRVGRELDPYGLTIDTARGVHRNMLGHYPLTSTDALVAWCIGDEEWLQEVMIDSGYLTHIGARRRAGHGRVRAIEIQADEAASDLWRMRVRPWPMLADDAPVQAAWKAPYWVVGNRGPAFCPASLLS